METVQDLLQEALASLQSYLEQTLDDFDEAESVVEPDGLGRARYLSLISEFKAALAALAFTQAIVLQQPPASVLQRAGDLQPALAVWQDALKQLSQVSH
jgi:hypothetical protein